MVSDNLNASNLGAVIDVYGSMSVNFNETEDIEIEIK